MRYRNFSIYVQKQIDRILRSFNFARAYIDDIVISFEIFENHLLHFREIFQVLIENNFFINSRKLFLNYSSINLLNQHVTFSKLFTDEKKLKTVVNFSFSKTLRQLEIYLNLTQWLRQYIEKYTNKFISLQHKKTMLLRSTLKLDKKKFYTSKVKINSTDFEIEFFNIIQKILHKSIYLVHFNSNLQLYADFGSSKENDVETMIYHVD